ncbi:MAG: energy transducer TonB [Bacteroidota bacterium]
MLFNIALSGWVVTTAMLGLVICTFLIILFLRREFHNKRVARGLNGEFSLAAEQNRVQALQNRTKYQPLQVFALGKTFFSYGLFVAAICCLLAISWEKTDTQTGHYQYADAGEVLVLDLPPITPPPTPPPPPPQPPVIDEVEPEELIEDPPPPPSQSFDDLVLNEPPPAPDPTPPPSEPVFIPPPPRPQEPEEPFVIVERMPLFPGCETDMPYDDQKICAEGKLLQYINGQIRYPSIAQEIGQSGTAVVRFVIEKDGRVTQIELIRDPGAGLGEEAQRVVELMQSQDIRWIPGNQGGRPVRVQFNLPVRFRLE